jgi:hypothetical protein
MTKKEPYISSVLLKLAARKGFNIEVRMHKTARKNGWPQDSTRPIHLLRDGEHVASFADGLAAGAYLCKQTGNA